MWIEDRLNNIFLERILNSTSRNQKEATTIDSFVKTGSMKSLAIIGMMFCSIGLFAQQSENVNSRKKEKVCVIERAEVDKKSDMKLAPIRQVDSRKTSVRSGKAKIANRTHMKDERMVVPVRRKNVKVDARM